MSSCPACPTYFHFVRAIGGWGHVISLPVSGWVGCGQTSGNRYAPAALRDCFKSRPGKATSSERCDALPPLSPSAADRPASGWIWRRGVAVRLTGRVFMITLQQLVGYACSMDVGRQHGTEGGRRPGLRRRMHTQKPCQKGRMLHALFRVQFVRALRCAGIRMEPHVYVVIMAYITADLT